MAPRKQVSTLFSCSLQKIADKLQRTAEKFLKDTISLEEFTASTDIFQLQLCNVFEHRHAEIFQILLKIVDTLRSQNCDFRSCSNTPSSCIPKIQFVTRTLVSIATHLKVREVTSESLCLVSSHSLLHYLWRLDRLRYLKFSCSLKDFERQQLLDRLPFLTKLTHLKLSDCTDKIVAVLIENCTLLESMDLSYSNEVTDESIASIALLKKLQTVDLTNTQVSERGLVKLLLTSQSKNLVEICWGESLEDIEHRSSNPVDTNAFFNHLETEVMPFRTFNLQRIVCENVDSNGLSLISRHFPLLKTICIVQDLEKLPDFSVLNSFEHLERVQLIVTGPSAHIKNLLSVKSLLLTELLFFCYDAEVGSPINLARFLEFGVHCPNLESITLEHCLFSDDFRVTRLTGKPFQKLKVFKLTSADDVSNVEVILSHATNIEQIIFDATAGLTDDFLVRLLQSNELRKLEVFHHRYDINDVSVQMLKHIIDHCPRISTLGFFEQLDSQDPNMEDDVKELQAHCSKHNYNIKLVEQYI